jgi:hypothetical protein
MKEKTKTFLNNIGENITNSIFSDEKKQINGFEDLNINSLNNYYSKEDSIFKKNIDKLNMKFFSETNKYINMKTEMEKTHDNLFVILFKQISSYIEEIEKLNSKLRDKEGNERIFKNKLEEVKINLK